jgi:hypothetical protein
MGRADAVKHLIPAQIQPQNLKVLENRMDLREGPQTQTIERLGNAADATHTALLQDLPANPGKPPVIRLFAAWPRDWDAAFTLLARGGFVVSSSMNGGKIEFAQIKSLYGEKCRLRNPWPAATVTLYRDSKKAEELKGDLLVFATRKDETIVILPRGSNPPTVHIH